MIKIGPYRVSGRAVLAPMAGVTDLPFREVCRASGAALVTAEMAASNPRLLDTPKSRLRRADRSEAEPRIVQIVGTEAAQMANAARYQVEHGAQIVDINMGCPAKKVCKRAAGSALLRDPPLVEAILRAVIAAVDVPVTLKIRTGWDPASRNAVQIAKLAEDCGVQSLAVHGRTRACRFNGAAEYASIAAVVAAVSIPVFANGDIDSAQKAHEVLRKTGAAGVMIGRAARGNPWIFSEINELTNNDAAAYVLFTDKSLIPNEAIRRERLIINHLRRIHSFYSHFEFGDSRPGGQKTGNNCPDLAVKVARKHVCWYFDQLKHVVAKQLAGNSANAPGLATGTGEQVLAVHKKDHARMLNTALETARSRFNKLDSQAAQSDFLQHFLGKLRTIGDIAA
ncbi:MAG: tRNA dihydrouridine synthase DusB [Pseudomonadales bacterium]|nr:MAG: tRNA dihydrouridine synthase DusB [Pseudomonadales bacterium]